MWRWGKIAQSGSPHRPRACQVVAPSVVVKICGEVVVPAEAQAIPSVAEGKKVDIIVVLIAELKRVAHVPVHGARKGLAQQAATSPLRTPALSAHTREIGTGCAAYGPLEAFRKIEPRAHQKNECSGGATDAHWGGELMPAAQRRPRPALDSQIAEEFAFKIGGRSRGRRALQRAGRGQRGAAGRCSGSRPRGGITTTLSESQHEGFCKGPTVAVGGEVLEGSRRVANDGHAVQAAAAVGLVRLQGALLPHICPISREPARAVPRLAQMGRRRLGGAGNRAWAARLLWHRHRHRLRTAEVEATSASIAIAATEWPAGALEGAIAAGGGRCGNGAARRTRRHRSVRLGTASIQR